MDDGDVDWSSSTIIDHEEIEDHIFEVKSAKEDPLTVTAYSVEVRPSGVDLDGLCDLIGNKFKYFVFSEKEIDDLNERGRAPHRDATQHLGLGNQVASEAGVLGEILLFLIMDGVFDFPMVSHKISDKQDAQMQVLGSDGIFVGSLEDETVIGLGEAKVKGDLGKAIRGALDSILDFHDSSGKEEIERELQVAPNKLSDNLEDHHWEMVTEMFAIPEYRDHRLVHPTIICYEEDSIDGVDHVGDADSIKEEIVDVINGIDYIDRIGNNINPDRERVKSADLFFIFLPMGRIDDFREQGLGEIAPGYWPIIRQDGDDLDALDSSRDSAGEGGKS